MERLMSSYGVEQYSDHTEAGSPDTSVIDDCIDQASGEIAMYLGQRYDVSSLSTNELVNRWAATVASYFLTTRRGNPTPDSLKTEFMRLMDFDTGIIPRVGRGEIRLDGVAPRADMTPSFSNMTIDRRYPVSKTRVVHQTSSKQPSTLPRNLDYRYDQ